MNLEQNNLEAQRLLMTDIIDNFKSITYDVSQRGKEVLEILKRRTIDDNEPILNRKVILTNDDYEAIFEIALILSEQSNFHKLGILTKDAVPDNVTKLKLLQLLRK